MKRIADEKRSNSELEAQIVSQQQEMQNLKKEVHDLENTLVDVRAAGIALREKIAFTKSKIESLAQKKAQLTTLVEEQNKLKSDQEAILKILEEEVNAKRAEIQALDDDIKRFADELQLRRQKRNDLTSDLQKARLSFQQSSQTANKLRQELLVDATADFPSHTTTATTITTTTTTTTPPPPSSALSTSERKTPPPPVPPKKAQTPPEPSPAPALTTPTPPAVTSTTPPLPTAAVPATTPTPTFESPFGDDNFGSFTFPAPSATPTESQTAPPPSFANFGVSSFDSAAAFDGATAFSNPSSLFGADNFSASFDSGATSFGQFPPSSSSSAPDPFSFNSDLKSDFGAPNFADFGAFPKGGDGGKDSFN
jgi:hypothetical protein